MTATIYEDFTSLLECGVCLCVFECVTILLLKKVVIGYSQHGPDLNRDLKHRDSPNPKTQKKLNQRSTTEPKPPIHSPSQIRTTNATQTANRKWTQNTACAMRPPCPLGLRDKDGPSCEVCHRPRPGLDRQELLCAGGHPHAAAFVSE